MRLKFLPFFVIFAAFSSFARAQDAPGTLYSELSRGGEVKIFVATPTDPSGKSGLDAALLKTSIEEALKARKSIRFTIAATEAEAKFKVETEIEGFMFSEHDPVDMLVGVGAAAMDAAKVDHFASVDAKMSVKEISGRQRWADTIHASITDEKITEAESRSKILGRAAEVFVREAFGKARR